MRATPCNTYLAWAVLSATCALLWTALMSPGIDRPIHSLTSEFDIRSRRCNIGCDLNNRITEMKCHYLGNGSADCVAFATPYIETTFESVQCKKYNDYNIERCYVVYSLRINPEQNGEYIQNMTVSVIIDEDYMKWSQYLAICALIVFILPLVMMLIAMYWCSFVKERTD